MTGSLASVHPELIPEWSEKNLPLGVFFVSEDLLCEDVANVTDELKEKFAYKVLEYLWDDVAKFERDNWFNSNIKSLDKLVEEYVKSGIEVFKDGIFGKHTS